MKFRVEWTFEGGRNEKSRRRREPNPLSIRSICWYVRERTFCQIEWYRDSNVYYYRLKLFINLGRFFYCIGNSFGILLYRERYRNLPDSHRTVITAFEKRKRR